VILCHDADETTRSRALTTLNNWNSADLKQVFSNPETPAAVLEFAVHRLVSGRRELAEALASNPALPAVLLNLIDAGAGENARHRAAEEHQAAGQEDIAETAPERLTLHQRIGRMTVVEKINAALMGSQEERTILVRDSNKIVSRAVLQSPKLGDQEVENIATMKNVSEEVLRLLAVNRKFIRSYGVARNLINNPRTPIDTGLPLLHRMNDRDLKELSRNKNVAEVIRSMANKMVKQKEQANKPKLPRKH
jgi:hypothetical protein